MGKITKIEIINDNLLELDSRSFCLIYFGKTFKMGNTQTSSNVDDLTTDPLHANAMIAVRDCKQRAEETTQRAKKILHATETKQLTKIAWTAEDEYILQAILDQRQKLVQLGWTLDDEHILQLLNKSLQYWICIMTSEKNHSK